MKENRKEQLRVEREKEAQKGREEAQRKEKFQNIVDSLEANWYEGEEAQEIKSKFSVIPGVGAFYNNNIAGNPRNLGETVEESAKIYAVGKKYGFLKSQPMDLAWRMLKGELQLPNEISEDMRRDLAVLDRNHTFEETSDGTMVGNIHPDMEHVVKLLTGMQEDVDDIAKPTYTPPQFYY